MEENNSINETQKTNERPAFIDKKVVKLLKITGVVFAGMVVLLVSVKILQITITAINKRAIQPQPVSPTGTSLPTPTTGLISIPTKVMTDTQKDLEMIDKDVNELKKEDSRFEPPNLIFELKLQQ